MSAAPYAAQGNRRRQRQTINPESDRQADAFWAGDRVLRKTRHSVDLVFYYKHLVARCGPANSYLATYDELAESFDSSARSIQRYDGHLERHGLIWREKVGKSYRRYITAYQPRPEPLPFDDEDNGEIVALDTPEDLDRAAFDAYEAGDTERGDRFARQAVFARMQGARYVAPEPEAEDQHTQECKKFSPPINDRSVAINTTGRSETTFNKFNQLNDQQATACQGGGGITLTDDDRRSTTDAIPHNETTRALAAIGMYPGTIQKYSARPFAEVERMIRIARHKPDVRDVPAFVAHLLAGGFVPDDEHVWKRRGKQAQDTPGGPMTDDDEAWRDKYTGGPLGPYIRTGFEDEPPDDDHGPPGVPPDEDDPELAKYRSIGVPKWLDGGAA